MPQKTAPPKTPGILLTPPPPSEIIVEFLSNPYEKIPSASRVYVAILLDASPAGMTSFLTSYPACVKPSKTLFPYSESRTESVRMKCVDTALDSGIIRTEPRWSRMPRSKTMLVIIILVRAKDENCLGEDISLRSFAAGTVRLRSQTNIFARTCVEGVFMSNHSPPRRGFHPSFLFFAR